MLSFIPSTNPNSNPNPVPMVAAPVSPGRKGGPRCLPKAGVYVEALQRNIDYVCGLDVDYCGAIKEGGECWLPNTGRAHAALAMNAYYQAAGRNDYDCDAQQTGAISNVDPRYGN